MFDPLKNLVTDCNYTHIFEIRYGFQYLFSLEDLLKDPIISDQSTFLISYILTNIMYTRVSPYYNVCYIWSLTQLMIHR